MNDLSSSIIAAAIEVQTAKTAARSLQRGSTGLRLPAGFSCGWQDWVEVKGVDVLLPIHRAQVLSYLKLGGWKLGLLNFHVPLLREGIKRVVLSL
jgi:PD-(D/E)XK nuclease superfamily